MSDGAFRRWLERAAIWCGQMDSMGAVIRANPKPNSTRQTDSPRSVRRCRYRAVGGAEGLGTRDESEQTDRQSIVRRNRMTIRLQIADGDELGPSHSLKGIRD